MSAALRAVAAIAFAALAIPAVASAAKPVLAVSTVSASPRAVEAGTQLKVAYTIKGRGAGRLTLRLATRRAARAALAPNVATR